MGLFGKQPKTFDPGEWVPRGVEPDLGGHATWHASFTKEGAPKAMIVFSSAATSAGLEVLATRLICGDIRYPFDTMKWHETEPILTDGDFEYDSVLVQAAWSAAEAIAFGRGEELPGICGLHEKITRIFTWDGASQRVPSKTGGA